MSTLTAAEAQRIADWLEAHPSLSRGRGSRERACSVAAINLALTGVLTDTIPTCMSEVVGRWIIRVQDAMPVEIRDSAGWRALLPAAAGTGREWERERLAIIMEWMWSTVLPVLQPAADDHGFGTAWSTMLTERSALAANAARDAAAAHATYATAYATATAGYVADAARAYVAYAARNAVDAANAAARAYAAYYAAGVDASAAWRVFDPVGLLAKLVTLPDTADGSE